MSMLFISTSKPPEFDESISYRIDPDEYAKEMKKRWPYAKVGRSSLPTYVLSWDLDHKERLGPPGGLYVDGLAVSFGSNPQADSIDFILWHRAFVPEHQELFLFDESMKSMELTSDTSREELYDFINS